MREINEYKNHISMWGTTCYYCGDIGNTIDHVPPQSGTFSGPENLRIKSCNECNVLLSNRILKTIVERKDYLLKAYANRYRKLLSQPDWTTEELEELGSTLRETVINSKAQKLIVEERLKNLSLGTT